MDNINANTYAALDLGSNSFHLLIARFEEGKLEVIDRHKEMVRLADGLRDDGSLSKSSIERALDCLRRVSELLASTPNACLRVVGTNTLRTATNAYSFLSRAEEILKSPISIISGLEEARLIYLGVGNDFSQAEGSRLVVDIGGGSTELIIGGQHRPKQLESLRMGCVNYSKQFFPGGYISPKAFRKAVLSARERVSPVGKRFNHQNWQVAVGASGTIRSIELILGGMGLINNQTITAAGLAAMAEALCEFKHYDEIKLPELHPDRRPVLPGGLAILKALFQELDIDEMHVSNYALREGVVLDLAGRLHNHDVRSETVSLMMTQYRVDEAQAGRVESLTIQLLEQVRDDFGGDFERIKSLLVWSIKLHEIGLSIAHNSYHKHGAYLLENSDMPGFSKQEQKTMAFLVLNHRKKLNSLPETYGFDPDWRLVQIMRLACLLNRCRSDTGEGMNIKIRFIADEIKIKISKQWLANNPLTAESLETEKKLLRSQNIYIDIIKAA